MNKIVDIKKAIEIAQKLKIKNKSIVVVGGFFDILHLGHINFLKESKKYGDYLFVLLEEDSKAAKEKGKERPINSQENRAKVLSSIQSIDYVVMLKNMTSDRLYDRIMVQIHPNVIATTYGDPYVKHKKRQADLINGKIVYAIKKMDDHSTTKYINLIKK